MSLPAGYSYSDEGHIMKDDGTGPYIVSGTGEVTLMGSTLQSTNFSEFTPGSKGLFFRSDGSGPYVKGSDGMYLYLG